MLKAFYKWYLLIINCEVYISAMDFERGARQSCQGKFVRTVSPRRHSFGGPYCLYFIAPLVLFLLQSRKYTERVANQLKIKIIGTDKSNLN